MPVGKHGDPSKLNAWAGALSTASSALTAVVSDLKAASPYSLQDASFGNQRVTAGTTHVTVGHYMGYNGNQGAPITKVETKWVTEKVMTGSGVAQNSGSFMTWLPGSVPSFGNTANTWQGYAASMFANLLQDFVNTVEEIKNTIDQLSKELSALATSISDSRKWWHILLEIVLPIVVVLIGVVVNFFFPGLGAAILGFLSTGLRFLGSVVGIVSEVTAENMALDTVGTLEVIDAVGAGDSAIDVSSVSGLGGKFSSLFSELVPGGFESIQVWSVTIPDITFSTADGAAVVGDLGGAAGEEIPAEFSAIFANGETLFVPEGELVGDGASVLSGYSVESSVGWNEALAEEIGNWLRPIQEIGNWPPPVMPSVLSETWAITVDTEIAIGEAAAEAGIGFGETSIIADVPTIVIEEIAAEAGPSALFDIPELLPGALDPGAFLSSAESSFQASVASSVSGALKVVDSEISSMLSEVSSGIFSGASSDTLVQEFNFLETIINQDLSQLPELEQEQIVQQLAGISENDIIEWAPVIAEELPSNMLRAFLVQLSTSPQEFMSFFESLPLLSLQDVYDLLPVNILENYPEITAFVHGALGIAG